MKLRILVILVVLALIAGVAYRIQTQQAGDVRRGGDRALVVKTVPVTVREFPRVLDLPGTLEAAQQRIAQNQATLSGAHAETTEAQKKLDRLAPLMQSGYISQQEYDDARLALEAARARAGTARADLQAAQLDVQYAQIRAPIAGRVGRINVRPGSLVQAGGEPLTTILAPGALDVRASVAQQDWPELAAARAQGKVTAEVSLDANIPVQAHGELVRSE